MLNPGINAVRPVWHESFEARHSEVDADGRLKLRALADYLQEAAARHAAHIGVGCDALARQNLLWVLSRIAIVIENQPGPGDRLEVETWPRTPEKLFAMREFSVYGENGLPVCRASSAWLLLDAKSFRPKKIETLDSAIPRNEEKPFLTKTLPKIEQAECTEVFTQQIRPSAIDINGHLNNAEYFALAQDALAMYTGSRSAVHEIRVNFVADLKSGETVTVFAGNGPAAGKYYAEGRNDSGRIAFQAEIVLR
ncbi:MAG: acyl-ACP thioesterase domain-containing protein [Victivallaceae bacterium]|jgi:acyl-ACP thioesterase